MSFWTWVRRFAALWGFGLFIIVVAALAHRVLLPFVLALLLAYVLAPAVGRLTRLQLLGRPLPRAAAVLVIYLGIVGALALFFGLFLPRLSGDMGRLLHEAPAFFKKINTVYRPNIEAWLEDHFPSEEPPVEEEGPRPERKLEVRQTEPGRWDVSLEGLSIEVSPAGNGRYVIGPRDDEDIAAQRPFDLWFKQLVHAGENQVMRVLDVGQRLVIGVVRAIAQLVLILMVAAFLLVDLEKIRGFLRGLVPEPYRAGYDELTEEADRGLNGVIRGQFLICLVNAVLTYIGLLILHVKYPLVLALVAGMMSLVPVFGSILSSIPIVAVALVGGARGLDVTAGLLTLGWIIGIHLLEANLLNPKIVGHAARMHPVLVVFSLVVGETAGGLVGALIAVPIGSLVQTLFLFIRRRVEASSAPRDVEVEG